VDVQRLTGACKNLTRGVVALVFRCEPVGGRTATTDEALRVQWLTADEIRDRMQPAYAVPVLDALVNGTAYRAHDGTKLVAR
jgi:8-oxo-dGTP diphosphatase